MPKQAALEYDIGVEGLLLTCLNISISALIKAQKAVKAKYYSIFAL